MNHSGDIYPLIVPQGTNIVSNRDKFDDTLQEVKQTKTTKLLKRLKQLEANLKNSKTQRKQPGTGEEHRTTKTRYRFTTLADSNTSTEFLNFN